MFYHSFIHLCKAYCHENNGIYWIVVESHFLVLSGITDVVMVEAEVRRRALRYTKTVPKFELTNLRIKAILDSVARNMNMTYLYSEWFTCHCSWHKVIQSTQPNQTCAVWVRLWTYFDWIQITENFYHWVGLRVLPKLDWIDRTDLVWVQLWTYLD